MRRWNRSTSDDEGSAALEFIFGGVILLVPLVYLVIVLGAIQQGMLGVEAAARHTARVIGQADDALDAAADGDAVLASVIEEYGLDPATTAVSLTCTPAGVECPSAGATVVVTVSARISLPLVPEVFGLDRATAIPLEAASAQKVSRVWGAP